MPGTRSVLPHSLSAECPCGPSLLRPVSGGPVQGEGHFGGKKRAPGWRVGARAGDVADESRRNLSDGLG